MEKLPSILLIEDDEEDKALFEKSLAEVDTGIVLRTTASGREGLEYLNNEDNPAPDYIFLDLRMPGISGKQCLIEIKKISRLENVPVIVYTTSRNVKESIELKTLGAAHFMSKPTSPQEVYYLISMVLESKFI